MQQGVRKFYLFGQNIETSLSPLIHSLLFKAKEQQGFQYLRAVPSKPPNIQEMTNDEQFAGATLTIPFKKYLFTAANIIYQGTFAQKTRTINTLIKEGKQKFIGYNTDIYAIQRLMDPLFQNKLNSKGSVFVLGAGATAETFCQYFSNQETINAIVISNRTEDKVTLLKQQYPKVKTAQQDIVDPCLAIINTLPTSAISQCFPQKFLSQAINSLKGLNHMTYMDVNYRDREKQIQQYLKERLQSLEEIMGLDMLIWQAIEQNRLFCRETHISQATRLHQYEMLRTAIAEGHKI